jgi:hypothetical protein
MARRSSSNSAKRRKDATKPLREWGAEVFKLEQEIRASLGERARPTPTPAALVEEVMRLSNPDAVRERDVVIPGTRVDLARGWMEARLKGRGDDPEDWLRLTREIAPLPDAHLSPIDTKKGTRYRSDNKRQDDITRSARREFRSK